MPSAVVRAAELPAASLAPLAPSTGSPFNRPEGPAAAPAAGAAVATPSTCSRQTPGHAVGNRASNACCKKPGHAIKLEQSFPIPSHPGRQVPLAELCHPTIPDRRVTNVQAGCSAARSAGGQGDCSDPRGCRGPQRRPASGGDACPVSEDRCRSPETLSAAQCGTWVACRAPLAPLALHPKS
jgi:hypothetical protein